MAKLPFPGPHRIYHYAIPWAGYLALLWVAPQHWRPATLSGWILMLVWILMAPPPQPFVLRQPGSFARLRWLLVPLLVLLSQPIRAPLSLAQGVIELAICEFASFTLCLAWAMARAPEADKGVAWPGIIMMLGLSGVQIYALGLGWLTLAPSTDVWSAVPLVVALALAMEGHWRYCQALFRNEVSIESTPFLDEPLRVVAALLLWWLLPLMVLGLRWLMA